MTSDQERANRAREFLNRAMAELNLLGGKGYNVVLTVNGKNHIIEPVSEASVIIERTENRSL